MRSKRTLLTKVGLIVLLIMPIVGVVLILLEQTKNPYSNMSIVDQIKLGTLPTSTLAGLILLGITNLIAFILTLKKPKGGKV